ncbi:bifunctional 23S rRNA (guanine(2069)-N(7))-methyltransferase RlmK/23S rRNA (guanine(2445)-N(2))-methyltransferase RlmL [Larsenimonas suaedae]|uniref:Ribosomal RNA large subunit methyltransferase K/L n=1 Tax=Larsenimonas suaedae TaxID=1851019 RepID=A0ABU1GXY4_9GAMM|nr:bifunctional 23S rRNA (guanine(2069)-N(7))-methyltransferase RlmK/23S rRNA (guanine(2445)-N(2))-methyltransferase RlmL [Larsenimonas suaedae]MCM2972807.1 bifunctional 23S rRNA (guanine(2069)-N(7))-methyltransferase RlmK/23S rRNA (guanine(2445)-N(2))-methyltransferase RlmL [Larsenimonas suaedae]MDR5896906.1 bifunctional 23S rRNA (guanine(2069)-N(7))-methyltransferase RlmK/23S rRNA (guanine(2445)-N(2))-methyltransferase RlmL [Larsenimonas suaedae]
MTSDASIDSNTYCVTCPWGLESLLSDELTALGATVERTAPAAVFAQMAQATLYKALLGSYLANRIILVLAHGDAVTGDDLTALSRQIPWENVLLPGRRIRVDFHGKSDEVRHTMFGAQKIKDGVNDRWSAHFDERLEVDPKHADSRIYAHFHRERLMIGLDMAGDSLHLRGYRLDGGQAPLKENLAAALLVRAGWPTRSEEDTLLDPLCGSGTLVIEAALMAARAAPNAFRERFGCLEWAGHDAALWTEIVTETRASTSRNLKRARFTLHGADRDPRAVEAARTNAKRAGVSHLVTFERGALAEWTPDRLEERSGWIMTNPPYGERIGDVPELIPLYETLGQLAKALGEHWQLAVFTGNPELGHRMGLKADKRYSFRNGALECKLLLCSVRPQPVQTDGAAQKAETPRLRLSEQAQMFANRLIKNRKQLSKWVRTKEIGCYRLYDADMPEFAVAVDIYGDHVHIQEYAPPKSIDAAQAERRLLDAVSAVTQVLEVAPENVHLKTRKPQKGREQYERQGKSRHSVIATEGPARFKLNLKDFLDTGLFLDHRPARRWLREHADGARVLNLFCYTATATVHAALGGARSSVSVDMSNTYLSWAEENYRLNRLDLRRHVLERADCFEWLSSARAQFDVIFMDPPTFSNSKKMAGVLDIQRDHGELIKRAMARLAPGGVLLFSNNLRRFKLDEAIERQYSVTPGGASMLDPDFKRRPNIHHVFFIRHGSSSES